MITEPGVPYRPSTAVSRMRLAIIGVVAALAAAIGVVLGSLLVAGGATSLARSAAYVPADAVMYLEARLDLPGQQRADLRAILERFPGLDPDDVLGDALATTLDAALADDDAPFDYSTDIAPWFDGTLAVALHDYPMNLDPMAGLDLPSMAGLVGVRDPAAAGAFADRLRAELEAEGGSFTSSQHAGITIWSLDVGPMPTPMPASGFGFAFAVADDQLILANDTAVVAASLDAANGDSLDDDGVIRRLLADLPEERVATMILNTTAMLAEMRAELDTVAPGMADAFGGLMDGAPAVQVSAVSFAADAVLIDGVAELGEGPFAPVNADRGLADRVPADAIAFGDGTNVGPAFEQLIVAMKVAIASAPTGEASLAELEQVEAALGAELEELVAWIGSAGWVAGWDGSEPYAGLLLEATDPDAAARRLNQLGALAQLAADGSVPIEVSRETVDGVEVTTIRAGSAETEAFGMPQVVLEYAIDGDVAHIGIGDRFVRASLALSPEASLAASARYRDAVGRFGGDDNAGVLFLDLAALRSAVESALDVESDPVYAEVRPHLEPFDLLAGVTRVDGDRLVSRLGLVLR